jgi:hypothetical protein
MFVIWRSNFYGFGCSLLSLLEEKWNTRGGTFYTYIYTFMHSYIVCTFMQTFIYLFMYLGHVKQDMCALPAWVKKICIETYFPPLNHKDFYLCGLFTGLRKILSSCTQHSHRRLKWTRRGVTGWVMIPGKCIMVSVSLVHGLPIEINPINT